MLSRSEKAQVALKGQGPKDEHSQVARSFKFLRMIATSKKASLSLKMPKSKDEGVANCGNESARAAPAWAFDSIGGANGAPELLKV